MSANKKQSGNKKSNTAKFFQALFEFQHILSQHKISAYDIIKYICRLVKKDQPLKTTENCKKFDTFCKKWQVNKAKNYLSTFNAFFNQPYSHQCSINKSLEALEEKALINNSSEKNNSMLASIIQSSAPFKKVNEINLPYKESLKKFYELQQKIYPREDFINPHMLIANAIEKQMTLERQNYNEKNQNDFVSPKNKNFSSQTNLKAKFFNHNVQKENIKKDTPSSFNTANSDHTKLFIAKVFTQQKPVKELTGHFERLATLLHK